MISLPKIFRRDKKQKNFLILEIGLERITSAIFERQDSVVKLAGVGKKSFSSGEETFDACLESLDALAAIVPDLPTSGVLGISGGSLETITTIARYRRPRSDKIITADETSNVLNQVVGDLGSQNSDKKIFFSTVSSADIDGVKVANPLGLKGGKIELSCFVAFKDTKDMELLDRIVNEIDLKVEAVVPTSYAAAKLVRYRDVKDALIIRAGLEKSESTVMIGGHVSEILPISLGSKETEFLPFIWQTSLKNIKKEEQPALIWLFADNDSVDLESLKESLAAFAWDSKLGFGAAPKVEVAETHLNFSASDIGIYALSQQEMEKR